MPTRYNARAVNENGSDSPSETLVCGRCAGERGPDDHFCRHCGLALDERSLPAVPDSLRALHRPESGVDIDAYQRFASPAHERLVLEELYLLELGLAMRRAQASCRPGVAIDAARPESRRAAMA